MNRIIDEIEYKVELLGPDVAHDLLVEIMACVGDGLSTEGVEVGQLLSKLDPAVVSKARKLFKDSCQVKIQGNWLPLNSIYDQHFKGKTLSLSKWMLFCLEAQYSDFLELMGNVTAPDAQ